MHSASQGGNLDLSVDAMGDGRIDPYHQAVLLEMGRWLAANGEAVYGTVEAPHQQNTTSPEGALIYFTASLDGARLFATATSWPGSSFSLNLHGRACPPPGGVSLLGEPTLAIKTSCAEGKIRMDLGDWPAGGVDAGPAARHAWVFRLSW